MGRTRDAKEKLHHNMATLQREIHHHEIVAQQGDTLLGEYCDVNGDFEGRNVVMKNGKVARGDITVTFDCYKLVDLNQSF